MSKRRKKKLLDEGVVVPTEVTWVDDRQVSAPCQCCSERDFDPNSATWADLKFYHEKLQEEVRRKLIAQMAAEYEGWVEGYRQDIIDKMNTEGYEFLLDWENQLTKVATQKACQDWVNTLHHTKMPWSDMPAEIDNNGEPQLHECQGCLAKQLQKK